jgi:hypothetical protein
VSWQQQCGHEEQEQEEMSLWKDLTEHPHYQVNTSGQVRSVRLWNRPKILRPTKNKNGYLMVALGRGNTKYVHQLVLLAFKGPRPAFCTASHLNGNRTDNRAINLIWESSTDNNARKIEHGTTQRGTKNGHALLTVEQVRTIKAVKDPEHGWYTAIAVLYGVHPNTIRDVHQRRTWRHI